MAFWNKVVRRLSGRREAPRNMTSAELAALLGARESMAGISVTPDSALKTAAVYACVRVLAETEAQLPLPVYRRQPDGGKERATDHWLYTLLNERPNAWQTAFEWREMMMGHVVLRGNAYSYINRIPSNGRIVELLPLHPGRMKVEQKADTTLSYIYREENGQEHPFRQGQIFHLRGIATDGLVGMTPIEAYREAVGLSVAAERHQATSFRHGVKFPGYLSSPNTLSKEAIDRLKEQFNSQHSGENAYKTPLLDGGLAWTNVGMSSEDAQVIETRKFQRSEVASIFRVPPHKIGDLERATFSNIEHQSLEFVQDTMLPWLRRWEQAIHRDLIPDMSKRELFAEHLVDGLLRGDIRSRYQAHALAIQWGWKSRNEVRVQENLNPADGLDEFLTPLNMREGDEPVDPRIDGD